MPELVPSEELPTKAKVSKSIQAAWAYKGHPSARMGGGTDRRPGAPIRPLWSCRSKGVQPAMLGLWSLLLFWGLATPCQGLLETVGTLARIGKDELGRAIQNSLVGGPVLQNVLGSVTAVNQGLLGSGGLLGGGGLLGHGGVFGIVEELSGLKIEELTLPKESLKLLPGFGVQLNLHTKVGMHCSGPLGGLLQLAAEVNVTSRVALGVSSRGTPILILKRCSTLLGHISLFLGLLPTPLFGVVEQMLFKVLPGLLCPVVDSVLGVVNELLGAVLGLVLGFSLATLPLISNQYIERDINPIVKSVAGDIIDFLKSPAPAKVPPKEDHTSQVTVPLYLFNTMFGLLQTNGVLDMDITPELEVTFDWSGLAYGMKPTFRPCIRLNVKVVSSFTHAFDESRLKEWLSHVVRVVYAPKLNVALDVGIPLPKVLNISFSNSVLEVIENAVVLTVAS
ncbi:BPI fold-containing family B member 3 [Piliocolobus tephrosceles]|uniref:BPI fold-containing family B member 3 n=1 Tax=Piliocolobus tephrosceles TaxID=591936 RepID=UPI000C2AF7DD|nr:BPI fold-containing family B member 3 [Piliocolobus tephrosceles]